MNIGIYRLVHSPNNWPVFRPVIINRHITMTALPMAITYITHQQAYKQTDLDTEQWVVTHWHKNNGTSRGPGYQ